MEKNAEIIKNQDYIVDIIDNGYQGEGIAKIGDYIVFIPNAIKGETIKIKLIKVLKSYGYGKIIDIIKESPNRVEAICDVYTRCGGCNFMHMNYEEELKIKQSIVENTLKKFVGAGLASARAHARHAPRALYGDEKS